MTLSRSEFVASRLWGMVICHLQKPCGECPHNNCFWLPRHLEVPDQEYRYKEEGEVGDDVNCANGIPPSRLHGKKRESGINSCQRSRLTRLLHPDCQGHSMVISNMDIIAHKVDRASIAQTVILCRRTGDNRRYKKPTEHFERKRIMI